MASDFVPYVGQTKQAKNEDFWDVWVQFSIVGKKFVNQQQPGELLFLLWKMTWKKIPKKKSRHLESSCKADTCSLSPGIMKGPTSMVDVRAHQKHRLSLHRYLSSSGETRVHNSAYTQSSPSARTQRSSYPATCWWKLWWPPPTMRWPRTLVIWLSCQFGDHLHWGETSSHLWPICQRRACHAPQSCLASMSWLNLVPAKKDQQWEWGERGYW